jgi:hypothetical protein
VTITSSSASVCSVSGFVLSLVAAGNCLLSASTASASGFAAATSGVRTVAITAISQTISFSPTSALTLDQSPFTLVASASSGLPVTITSSSASVCSVSGFYLTLVSAGNCVLSASQLGGSGYAAAPPVSKTIVLSTKAQTISFSAPSALTLGQSPYTLVASASSGLPVTITSRTSSVCSVRGLVLTLGNSGTCRLTANQSGSTVYSAAESVLVDFEVSAMSDSITAIVSTLEIGKTYPVASILTSTSGRQIRMSGGTPGVCSIVNLYSLKVDTAGFCEFYATAPASGGWGLTQGGAYSIRGVNPPVLILSKGNWVTTPSSAADNSLSFSLNTGTSSFDANRTPYKMKLEGYYYCSSSTVFTPSLIPNSCFPMTGLLFRPLENSYSLGADLSQWNWESGFITNGIHKPKEGL